MSPFVLLLAPFVVAIYIALNVVVVRLVLGLWNAIRGGGPRR